MSSLRNGSLFSADFRRKVRLTRLGAHFLFVGCFAMLGGALRGFNLLLVVAGVLIGALLVQWRFSRNVLLSLSVARQLPEHAFAGEPFRLAYDVTNHSRWLTIWIMRLEDRAVHVRAESVNSLMAPARCALEKIRCGETETAWSEMVLNSRGEITLGPLVTSTTFPFDLFAAQLFFLPSDSILIYPRLVRLRRGWKRVLPVQQGGSSDESAQRGRAEGDFLGLREWRTGDKLRWIHWRTSARTNEPVVCQYDQPTRLQLCLLVDAFAAEPSNTEPSNSKQTDHDGVETAISLAASMLLELVSVQSSRVVLAVAATSADAVRTSATLDKKRQMLGLLARIQVTAKPNLIAALEQANKIGARIRDVVVISSRPLSDALDGMTAAETATFERFRRRGTFRWVNVNDPQQHDWFETSPATLHQQSFEQADRSQRNQSATVVREERVT